MVANLDSVFRRLDELDDDFSIFTGKAKAKASIDALEKKLGVPLLPDHRALIAKHAACAVVADEEVWAPPVQLEMRPAWQHAYGIEVFGVVPASAAALDVLGQSAARKPAGKKRFVAAMRRFGDSACVGYDASGKLFTWEPGAAPAALGAKSTFASILDEWLTTIVADKDKMKKLAATKTKTKTKAKGDSAEEWLERLRDDDDGEAAGKKLMKEPPAVRKAVIALVAKSLAKGGDEDSLLWALAHIVKDDAAVDALVGFAAKGSTEVRTAALGILGTSEAKAARVVPVILKALGDADEDFIAAGADALADYADATAIAPLTKALAKVQKNPRWVHGVAAAYIFEALAAAAKRGKPKDLEIVVDVLTANLAPKDRFAALPAFEMLIELGPRAKRAIPTLEKSAASKDLYLASLARHALGAITGDYKPHAAALTAAAKSKDIATRSVAEGALADAKKKRKKLLPHRGSDRRHVPNSRDHRSASVRVKKGDGLLPW